MDALADKKAAQENLILFGAPTMSLQKFYNQVLHDNHINSCEALTELLSNGLVITNQLSGPILSQKEVLDNISCIPNSYTVIRADIEGAYLKAGKSSYPWLNLHGELVSIPIKHQESHNIQPKNDTDLSGLLTAPAKIDDWFVVIDDMTRVFHAKCGNIPNGTKAWNALWASPPEGYTISTGQHFKEDCLFMAGAKPLSKRNFKERWKKYTPKLY